MWHDRKEISYHPCDDVTSVTSSVIALMQVLHPGDAVIIEAFCENHLTRDHCGNSYSLKSGLKWSPTENRGIIIHSIVCRNFSNKPVTSLITCSNEPNNQPVNPDSIVPQSLDATLYAFGVTDDEERRRIEEDISRKSEELMSAIIKREAEMSVKEKGEIGGQTDVIGIDLVLCHKNGVITPFWIKVGSHDCTTNCQIFEFVNAESSGKSVRPLVETMITRSQKFMVIGRTILVIGSGGNRKAFIWPEARKYGLKVILVDSDSSIPATRQVHKFLTYDYSDQTKDMMHAKNILKLLKKEAVTIDGCVAFWEGCVPLAASVCHLMDLPGPGLEAALTAKYKTSTQAALRTKTGDTPHLPQIDLYTSRTSSVKSRDDLSRVSKQTSFPAVLKLDSGCAAIGVALVRNETDLEKRYLELMTSLKTIEIPATGLTFGNDTVLMDYLDGNHHTVDIIIFKRKLVAAFLSDNGPKRLPYFTTTSCAMPSKLSVEKQNQLIMAAYQCCIEIGLLNGVFNVDLILTQMGPKLLEINARMGGYCLRDWINRCYGVDIMLCAFMIASGIKPILPERNPNVNLLGVMCVPSLHSSLLLDQRSLRLMHELCRQGDVIVNIFTKNVTVVRKKYEVPFANVAVMGSSKETAKKRLLHVVHMLNISSKDYDVESFLHSCTM